MLDVVLGVILTASAFWVYADASKNKIGKVETNKGFFNLSAGSWAIVALLLWIVAFPAYLLKRKKLIEIAKQSPSEASGRTAKLTAIAAVGAVYTYMAALSLAVSLPTCDDQNVENLVMQIIQGMDAVIQQNVQIVSINNISEQGYNAQTELRACTATLVSTLGENLIQYNIKWQNKDAAEFYTEVTIL